MLVEFHKQDIGQWNFQKAVVEARLEYKCIRFGEEFGGRSTNSPKTFNKKKKRKFEFLFFILLPSHHSFVK